MGKTLKYVKEFDFGPQKTFVQGYCRGGAVKKAEPAYAKGGSVKGVAPASRARGVPVASREPMIAMKKGGARVVTDPEQALAIGMSAARKAAKS